VLLVSCKR